MEDEGLIEFKQEEKGVQVRQEVVKEVMSFERLMEMSSFLSKSTVVPLIYQNRPENCFIALDMASRMGISPMIVMQNLYIIQGKPSWSGSAIASLIKASPQFKNVELVYVGIKDTDNWGAYVTAESTVTGKTLKGGTVTLGIAKKEGWYQKSGSKWQTMPEIMLGYRAFAWFGRIYAPELLMGLQSSDEVEDVAVEIEKAKIVNPFEKGV